MHTNLLQSYGKAPSFTGNDEKRTSLMQQHSTEPMAKVEKAIAQFKDGGLVIMTDDEGRENEGDLVFAAEFVNSEKVNFLAREARGLICLALDPKYIKKLDLPMMEHTRASKDKKGTAFTVSIEAREGVTTGISAADRAHTIQVAIDETTKPQDLVVPGHIFPLRARKGGVLERAGHTEGSVDLARLANLKPAAVICEIMNDDGTMARGHDLEAFAKKFKLPVVSIADLIHYRLLRESLVEKIDQQKILTSHGEFQTHVYQSLLDKSLHVALTTGEKEFTKHTVDVRVHSQRPLADVFGDPKTGSRLRIDYGLDLLKNKDHAALLYLTANDSLDRMKRDLQELTHNKLEGAFQDRALTMDMRLYGVGAQILRHLGIETMCIHTTQPRTLKGLAGFGLTVVDQQAITE